MAAAERTPIDCTSYFEGSVGKAQNHYNSAENDYEYIKVKSKSGGGYHLPGTWFHNPDSSNPSTFVAFNTGEVSVPAVATPAVAVADGESGIRDATSQFKGSVGTAQLYYRDKPYEHVQVFSKRVGKWYHNPNETEPAIFISMIKAIFFDVDKTLITHHTGGIYGDKTKGYIGKDESHRFITSDRLATIKKDLEALKSKGYILFINSRGNFKSVELLLHHLGLLEYFGEGYNILTAQMPEEIRSFYDIKDPYEIVNLYWDQIKTYFMNMVVTKYNLDKNDVWFFDDTAANISYAKEHGYVNSFIVDNNVQKTSLESYMENIFDIPVSSSGGKKNRRHRKGKKKIKRPRHTRRRKKTRTRHTRRRKKTRTKHTRRSRRRRIYK